MKSPPPFAEWWPPTHIAQKNSHNWLRSMTRQHVPRKSGLNTLPMTYLTVKMYAGNNRLIYGAEKSWSS